MHSRDFDIRAKKTVWPSERHRQIARHVMVDNSSVDNAEIIEAVIAAVLRIPLSEIPKVTLRQLQEHYGCPQIYVLGSPAPKKEGMN